MEEFSSWCIYLEEVDNDGIISSLVKVPGDTGSLSVVIARVVWILDVATFLHLRQ